MPLFLGSYYSYSDTWILLYAENIYLKFHFMKLGEMSRSDQISSLIDMLEQIKSDKEITNVLISIYYLICNVEEVYKEDEPKYLQITVIPMLASEISNLIAIRQIFRILKKIDINASTSDKDLVRQKILIDTLIFALWHYEQPNEQDFKDMLFEALDFCFDQIKCSISVPQINMKRVSKLMNVILKLAFHVQLSTDIEEIPANLKSENFQKLEKALENKSILDLIKLSTIREVEEFYINLHTDQRSPLSNLIVVGFLRGMLKVCSLSKGSAQSKEPCNKLIKYRLPSKF